MASYSDIPQELRDRNARQEFGDWLRKLTTDPGTKKRLMFLWSRGNGEIWTAAEVKDYAGNI